MSKLMTTDLTESKIPSKVKTTLKLNQENNLFKLYAINKYKGKTDSFIKNNYEEVTLEILKQKLKEDNGYHFRVDPKKNYIFFGDCDGFQGGHQIFFQLLKDFLLESYNIEINICDISYTINESKVGSYHYSIPKIYASCKKLKEIHENFLKKHNDIFTYRDEKNNLKKNIDITIYCKKWFRYPNQLKENVYGTEHIIKNGSIVDFIPDNIPKKSICIDENIFKNIVDIKVVKTIKSNDNISNDNIETIKNIKNNKLIQNDDKKIKQIKLLLECLNQHRCDSYIDWINIGFILLNELDENGYDIYKDFSKKSPNYCGDVELYKIWKSFKKMDDGLKIGSLIMYAKEDNIMKYIEYFNTFDYSNELSTTILANHFCELYGDIFMYVNNELYYYNGVYWKTDYKPYSELNIFLREKYYNILFSLLQKYDNTNKADNDNSKKVIKKRSFIEKMLRTNKYRKDLIEEIIHSIKKDIELDPNPYLFAFNNKIFDFEKNAFQECHNPKDYITITTGYDYDENYDKKKIKNLTHLLKQIFPNDEIKDLYMTTLVSGLCGIQVQHIICATGTGGNGKGVINELMMSLCGNYACVLSSSVLLHPIKEGANPEIAHLHNIRFVKVSEPDANKKMCTSLIKELTGTRNISARLCHSNNCNVMLKLTLVVECNKLGQFDEVTDAIFRRFVVALFESNFISKDKYKDLSDDQKINVFEANAMYTEESWKNDHKQALFEILRNYYKNFKENGIVMPLCMKKKCSEYLAISDDISEWIKEICYESNDKDAIIKIGDLFDIFKQSTFYNTFSKEDKRKYNKKYFFRELENNFFLSKKCDITPQNVKILKGFKIKVDDDDN